MISSSRTTGLPRHEQPYALCGTCIALRNVGQLRSAKREPTASASCHPSVLRADFQRQRLTGIPKGGDTWNQMGPKSKVSPVEGCSSGSGRAQPSHGRLRSSPASERRPLLSLLSVKVVGAYAAPLPVHRRLTSASASRTRTGCSTAAVTSSVLGPRLVPLPLTA